MSSAWTARLKAALELERGTESRLQLMEQVT